MTDYETYLNSLEEGDNITVTADFLDALKHHDEKIYEKIDKLIDCLLPLINYSLDRDDFERGYKHGAYDLARDIKRFLNVKKTKADE